MKTFLTAAALVAGIFPLVAVMADEQPNTQKKLQGTELTKFYLQQILEEAGDDSILDAAAEKEGLLQKLKDLVGRFEERRQKKLTKDQREKESREQEPEAKKKVGPTLGNAPTVPVPTTQVLKPVNGDPRLTAPDVSQRKVIHDPDVTPANAELPAATLAKISPVIYSAALGRRVKA